MSAEREANRIGTAFIGAVLKGLLFFYTADSGEHS